MAFMVPVMKQEFDIYKGRRQSECSNSSPACRSRKTSECRSNGSQSLSTSPAINNNDHHNNNNNNSSSAKRNLPHKFHHSQSMPMNRTYSRPITTRTSQTSLITSPTRHSIRESNNQMNYSPPTNNNNNNSNKQSTPIIAGSETSLNKFHVRLVDKLRKSLGKGRSVEDRS